MRRGLALGLGLTAALTLSACATRREGPPPSVPAPVQSVPSGDAPPASQPQPQAPVRLALADLPGWAADDHLAAFNAFRDNCRKSGDLAVPCAEAQGLGGLDAAGARRFFEAKFEATAVGEPGLLTAYFAPRYEARFSRQGEFTVPVRGKPADLTACLTGVCRAGDGQPYPDRAGIEATPEAKPLAWMRPEDLFFLQIQGSGVLVLPDGKRFKALFSAHNGRPFVGIAAALRDQGLLADQNTSAEAIRAWLAANRGEAADAVMRLNPRYVFFHLKPDDGREPVGAAGAPLPPGRAIAVDPAIHAYGGLYWLDADAPKLAGGFPAYRRLVTALDTGGAIKGAVRADLYLGSGPEAGLEAGRVRHALRLYRLTPKV